MTKILKTILGIESKDSNSEEGPKVEKNVKYRICTEDNPDATKYRCGGKETISPDCKLSLHVEGLTTEDMTNLEREVLLVLEKYGIQTRYRG